MVLYKSFWVRMKREALLFTAVYVTCLLLALLFNLVSFSSERLQLSIPLHEAPASEGYILQALAPLPIKNYTVKTVADKSAELSKPQEMATITVKKN